MSLTLLNQEPEDAPVLPERIGKYLEQAVTDIVAGAGVGERFRKAQPVFVEATAARSMLETDEVLGLVTTANGAGAAGFQSDHLGMSFAAFRQYIDAHGDPLTWRLFGRYLRDLGRQTAEGVGWIIEGTVGTGKTAVMALIAEAEMLRTGSAYEPSSEAEFRGMTERKPHLLFASMVDIADFCMRRDRDDAWERQFARWCSVTHLFIDDLGAEYLEPFGGNQFYKLIDTRAHKRLPTHLTLNGLVDDLGDPRRRGANAQRLESRLRRRNHVMTLAGPDRRVPLSPSELLGVEFV